MKEPHNHAKVGYAMIVVSASLAVIGLLGLGIGGDVLFGDTIQRTSTAMFEECKANEDNTSPECVRFKDGLEYFWCVDQRDLESPQCERYRTQIVSDIFEECRANRDVTSPQCQQ